MRNDGINVLWIEDDIIYKESFLPHAKANGINLLHFPNWEEGKFHLEKNLSEIDAILLDAQCILGKNDTTTDNIFLGSVVQDMIEIFTKYQTVRPWYVLTAGTMDGLSEHIRLIGRKRKEYEEEWGQLVYIKGGFLNTFNDNEDIFSRENDYGGHRELELLERLKKVCNSPNNVLARHRDTLKYLGRYGIFKGSARVNMVNLLNALYHPEDSNGFQFEGNPVRRIFECLVRACVDVGVIPEEVIKDGNVKCSEASRFLCGMYPKKLKYRFGMPDDRIFNTIETSIMNTILHSTNIASHESEEDYKETNTTINNNNRDEYSGCALLMCRIIKSLGKYIEENSDKEENKKKWKLNPYKYEGEEGEVKEIGGIKFINQCMLINKDWIKVGMRIKLTDVQYNAIENLSDSFPFFCRKPIQINS